MFGRREKRKAPPGEGEVWALILEHCERIATLETKVNALLWIAGVSVTVLVGILIRLLTHIQF